MAVLDEGADLRADRCTIKAHHKELTHLPATWHVSTYIDLAHLRCQVSRRGNSLNLPKGHWGSTTMQAWRWGRTPEAEGGQGSAWLRNRRLTYLSRSSQPGGSMSSFGAMALGEECQQGRTGKMQRRDPHEVVLQTGSALTCGVRPQSRWAR